MHYPKGLYYRKELPMAFQLPPEITFSKERLSDCWAYVFRHKELGELGRILLQEVGGQTRISCEVVGNPSDPITQKRRDIFEPLSREIVDQMGNQTGPGRPQPPQPRSRVNAETLQMRITRLKRLLKEIPEDLSELPEEVPHILRTAPKLLSDAEAALKNDDPHVIDQLHEVLEKTEVFIEWAVGSAKGKNMADAIQSEKEPSLSAPPYQRLNQRITQFLLTQVAEEQYLRLIKEFCGDDAVQGTTVSMDPRWESEAFSQWMLHDKILTGKSKRLIDLFAEKFMATIPPDEQDLLKSYVDDRPSIYQVAKFRKDRKTGKRKDTYLVEDLLSSGDIIRIKDRTSSKTLHLRAIFIGRAIPIEGDRLFNVLGSISELPLPVWTTLSEKIKTWSKEYSRANSASPQDFFRTFHARIRRCIYEQ